VAGKDLGTLANHKVPELRRQVGTVFQDFRLLPNKTITENVAFALHVLGYSQKEINREVPEVLELVGLEDKGDRLPSEISGGEQQRVAIARALVNDPALILADEPTGALDTKTSEEILQLFCDLNSQGITIVVVTHDPAVGSRARRRIRMEDGRITAEDNACAQ
jgi:cell division transport system ATP-binding protein